MSRSSLSDLSYYAQDYYAQDYYAQDDVYWPTYVDQDNLIRSYHQFPNYYPITQQFPFLPSKQREYDLEWVGRICGEFTRECSKYPHPETFKQFLLHHDQSNDTPTTPTTQTTPESKWDELMVVTNNDTIGYSISPSPSSPPISITTQPQYLRKKRCKKNWISTSPLEPIQEECSSNDDTIYPTSPISPISPTSPTSPISPISSPISPISTKSQYQHKCDEKNVQKKRKKTRGSRGKRKNKNCKKNRSKNKYRNRRTSNPNKSTKVNL